MKEVKLSMTPLARKLVEALELQLRSIGYGDSDLIRDIGIRYGENNFQLVMPLYGVFLDEGTRPHMPPIYPIERWIEKKGLDLNAWAVATNIKKFGTKPHPFLFVIDDVLNSPEAVELLLNEFDGELDIWWDEIK